MTRLNQILALTLYGLRIPKTEIQALIESPDISDLRNIAPIAARELEQKHWRKTTEKILEQSLKHKISWASVGESLYPRRLRLLQNPPLIFSYQGPPTWLEAEMISIVGSREPMKDSVDWMRRNLIGFFSNFPIGSVSGGARGIDALAHDLTLLSGRPTVCFIPSGLLNPYPKNHTPLFERLVAEGGTLVSGFGLESQMQKGYFHERNRWIAGLGVFTLIVEASRKSGSWLTARMALEEGRTVATLPVSPLSGRGLGNLDLLYDGAQLIRDSSDLQVLFAREIMH